MLVVKPIMVRCPICRNEYILHIKLLLWILIDGEPSVHLPHHDVMDSDLSFCTNEDDCAKTHYASSKCLNIQPESIYNLKTIVM